MKSMDRFEQKGLYQGVRFISLGMVLLLLLFIIAGGMYLVSELKKDTKITFEEVKETLVTRQSPGNQPPWPDTIKKYFSDEQNQNVLYDWLNELNVEQRKDFLDNLSQVIVKAEAENISVIDAVNTYRVVKLRKIKEHEADKNLQLIKVFGYSIVGFMTFGMIVILLQLLVLLSVERNTRNESSPGAQ
jgi:uncharacterized membrane protein YukC